MTYTVQNRLKTALDERQLENRLQYQPEIIEFHLTEETLFGDKRAYLEHTIERLQRMGIKVYLHHPMRHGGIPLDIISSIPGIREFYQLSCRILHEICLTHSIKCVVHSHYMESDTSSILTDSNILNVKDEIEAILEYAESSFLWEDSCGGVFSYENDSLFETIIKPLNLNLVQDISHSFISLKGDNQKLLSITKIIAPYVKYLHVVDSQGLHHDSLPLGKGRIDWNSLKPFTVHKDFIFEVSGKNHYDCSAMVESADYYNSI